MSNFVKKALSFGRMLQDSNLPW